MFGVMPKAHYAVVAEPPGEGVESDPQPGARYQAGQQAYHLALAVDHHVVAFAPDPQQQRLHVAPLVASGLLDDDQPVYVGVALCHARTIVHDQIVNLPIGIVLLEVVAQRRGDQHVSYLFGLDYEVFHARPQARSGLNVSATAYLTRRSDAAAAG
ncbi:hypothetical protein D3C80_1409890 [compost metagenome]